ncbi:hypothetical protein K7Y63_004150 [Serratia marcescens]
MKSVSARIFEISKTSEAHGPLLRQAFEVMEVQKYLLSVVLKISKKAGYKGDSVAMAVEFLREKTTSEEPTE